MTAPTADGWQLRRGQPGYPPALLDLGGDAPAALHGVGSRELVAGIVPEETATVVGARRATAYGRHVATELGRSLAAAGIVVVSGMAHGIDAAAHRGALDAGGATVAVLAGGPDVAYPPGQRRLYRDILTGGGAVVSEMQPGRRPERWGFPARNRIMAALARVSIVVEAGERSGSRHTVDWANRIHREVGAVPGPVTSRLSAGPHALLADGALLVRDAQDVLDALLGVGARAVRGLGPALEPELAAVLELVEGGASSCEAVITGSGLGAREAGIALARLELCGYLSSDFAGVYTRTALAPPEDSPPPGDA